MTLPQSDVPEISRRCPASDRSGQAWPIPLRLWIRDLGRPGRPHALHRKGWHTQRRDLRVRRARVKASASTTGYGGKAAWRRGPKPPRSGGRG